MRLVAVIPGKLCSQDSVHSVTKIHSTNQMKEIKLFQLENQETQETQNLQRSSSWNHPGQKDNQSISVIQNPWPINSHLFGSNNPAKHCFSLYANMASAKKVDLNIHLYPYTLALKFYYCLGNLENSNWKRTAVDHIWCISILQPKAEISISPLTHIFLIQCCTVARVYLRQDLLIFWANFQIPGAQWLWFHCLLL